MDRVMQIWLEGNIKAHDFIAEEYWKRQYDEVRRQIAAAEIYVCESCGKTIGFIGLVDNYIAGIFVDSECQSQGIGKMLLDYAKRLKPELQLHVYAKNINAIRFYQREKFKTISESTDENTGEKELSMKFDGK